MKSYLQHYGFWGLVRNSFVIYRRFFLKLVVIIAIFQLPALFLVDLTDFIFPEKLPAQIASFMLPIIPGYFGFLAIVGEISEICLGSTISITKALSRVSFRGVGRFMGTAILTLIVVELSLLGPPLVGFFGDSIIVEDISWGTLLGVFIGVILFTWVFVRYFFVSQVVVLERRYWWSALTRSSEIVRSHFWKVLFYLVFYLLLIGIPLFMATFGPAMFFVVVERTDSPWSLIWSFYGSVAIVITAPLGNIFMTLFYYSLRIENYDLSKENLVDIKTFEAI